MKRIISSCFAILIAALGSQNALSAEIYKKKITQFGDPTTAPQTRTSCVQESSTDVPYCETRGLSVTCGTRRATTCTGWKTETKTLQNEIFFVVNGPDSVEGAVKKSVVSCTDKATQLGVGVALAVIAKSGSKEAAAAAALTAASTFWDACMTAEVANRLSFNLSTQSTSHWTDWK